MTELDPDGLAALSRFLDFASGQFDLVMVRADSPDARAALEAWLREHVATLSTVGFDELGSDPLTYLRAHKLGDALLVTGLEGRTDAAFRALNVQRDLLIEVAPVPWILLGHHLGLADLQQVAPDFCDLVSVHVTVLALPDEPLRKRELAWLSINAHSGVFSRVQTIELDTSLVPGGSRDSEALVALKQVRLLRDAGDLAGALRSIEALRSGPSRDDSDETLFEHAELLHAMGRLTSARELLDRWWVDARRKPGSGARTMAHGSLMLGVVMRALGDLAGARRLIEQSLEQDGGGRTADVAVSLHELGVVLMEQGDLDGARRHLERSLAIQAEVFGTEDHPSVAASLHELAGVLEAQGELEGAKKIYERILGHITC